MYILESLILQEVAIILNFCSSADGPADEIHEDPDE